MLDTSNINVSTTGIFSFPYEGMYLEIMVLKPMRCATEVIKGTAWTEKGVAKTKAIPEKDVNWIKEVTENYRNFRKKCKEIQRLEKRIRSLLDQYGKDIVKKTRKLRKYL